MNPFDSRATTVLVLGILSIVLCSVLGPFAWIMGRNLRDEAAAAGWPEPGTAKAGRICGIVGTVLLGLLGVYLVVIIVAIIGGVGSNY